MKTKYKIRMYENRCVLEEPQNKSRVIEEDPSDKQHLKIKRIIGERLFDDIEEFLNNVDSDECEIEISFNETEEYKYIINQKK